MENNNFRPLLTKQLKHFRETYRYNQKDVAEYLGVARSAYSNYENGSRLPDVYMLDKLARLYNVSVEAFLYPPDLYNDFRSLHDLSYDQDRMPSIVLSDYEQRLIYEFRKLSPASQDEIIHLCEYKNKKAGVSS